MKIVRVSNFDRDAYKETVVISHVKVESLGKCAVAALNACLESDSEHYFRLVDDNYVLHDGFEP